MSPPPSASVRRRRRADTRLPLQPLLDALPIDRVLARQDVIGPGVIAQAARLLDVPPRSLHRWRHTGLNPWAADRLAVSSGLHPFSVWGDAWIDAIDIERGAQAHKGPPRYAFPSLSR